MFGWGAMARARERKQQWLMMVQTACLHYDLHKVQENPLWALADAMRVDARCIPPDLERASWDYVDSIIFGKPRPAWVVYLPEPER